MHAKLYGRPLSGATIVDVRLFFPDADSGSDVGDGTQWPIGFTLGELAKIFLNVKKFTLGGDGLEDVETKLLAFPTSALRQYLFAGQWTHSGLSDDDDAGSMSLLLGYNVGGGILGKKFADLYYPVLILSAVTTPGEGESHSYSTTALAGGGAGGFNILEKSCVIYRATEEDPAFGARVEILETWTI